MSLTSSQNTERIGDALAAWARGFEPRLAEALTTGDAAAATLVEAMQYSAQSGGKRVRPFIVTRICELCGGTTGMAAPAAVAIECVHAFSLVHDDLPAMDDDDLRRGRPTCHKAYGEAVAILAGDALLALAFEILATRIEDAPTSRAAVAELAAGTGWAGMIGGQTIDIQCEQKPPELSLVQEIHRYKTARLFESAGRLGAISARADEDMLTAAGEFGRHLGLTFQVADDLLDVTGTAERLGKAVAKDAAAGKQTYPAAVGIEASRGAAAEAAGRAVETLDIFGPAADDLRQLARFVIERDR